MSIDITFYLPYPQIVHNFAKYKYHKSRPDLDNLCKFLLDNISGVLITDDRMIYDMHAKKQYDNNPRTEFTITEI